MKRKVKRNVAVNVLSVDKNLDYICHIFYLVQNKFGGLTLVFSA